MANTPNEVRVKVEIDYDRLAQAIRDAIRSNVVVHPTPSDPAEILAAAEKRQAWESGRRFKPGGFVR